MELGYIDLKDSFWRKSLFRKMGFQKRAGTTGKVAISQAAREEIELVFFH